MFLEKYDTFNSAYWFLCHAVKHGGHWMEPRGEVTQEIRPCSFVIKDPARALYTGVERRLNYRFFAIEVAMYVGGRDDREAVEALCMANSNMKRFVNTETGTFDGAYGPRLAAGLMACCEALRANPWTRQAVASVWNNRENRDTLDLPCTLSLQFFCTPLSDDDPQPVLNLQASMRSNDLDWGTPYDVAAFCEIQCLMASVLGIPVGEYWHNAGSLHLYRDHHPNVDAPTARTLLTHEELDTKCHGTMLKTWGDVATMASRFVDRAREELMPNGGRFTTTEAKHRMSSVSFDPWWSRLHRLSEFSWRSVG